MRYISTLSLSLAAAGLLRAGQNSASQNSQMSSADQRFMNKAAQDGMAEVQLAQLAEQKASNQSIKNFAKQLEKDHTAANDELKQIAQSKNVTLPSSVDSMDKREYDRLSKLSGTEFDTAFVQHQVKDHEKDISAFKKEAENGQDSDVKSFASGKVSALEHHLQMAQSLAGGRNSNARMPNRGEKTTPRTDNSSKY